MRKVAMTSVLLLAALCAAQQAPEPATGVLNISPTDTTRTLLTGATITLIGEMSPDHEVTQTRSKFSNLPVDTYSIRVEKPGYRTTLVRNVQALAGQTGGLVVILQSGDPKDTINVEKPEVVYGDADLMERFYAEVPRKHSVDDIPGCFGRGMEPGVIDPNEPKSSEPKICESHCFGRGTASSRAENVPGHERL